MQALSVRMATRLRRPAYWSGPSEPTLFDWIFGAYGILLYEDAFVESIRIFAGQGVAPGETDRGSTIAQITMLTSLLIAIWLRRQAFYKVARDALPCLAIVGLCAVSALWSDFPIATLRRTANFGTSICFGIYLYAAFGFVRTVRLAAYCTLVAGIASLIAFMVLPSVGRETDPDLAGAMRGVFAQKNSCADSILLGLLCWIYMGAADAKLRRKATFAIITLFGCIVLARSASASIIGLIAMGMGAAIWFRRDPRSTLVIKFLAASVFITVTVIGIADPEGTLAILGRDPTLTGRVPLWEFVVQAVAKRPLLGYGFYGFWNVDSRDAQFIWKSVGWDAPTAHCGYLDLVLQLGLPGVAVYLWCWGTIVRLCLMANRIDPSPESAWILVLFMTSYLLLNLDEGPLPEPDIFGALTPFCLVTLNIWRRENAFAGIRRRLHLNRQTTNPLSLRLGGTSASPRPG